MWKQWMSKIPVVSAVGSVALLYSDSPLAVPVAVFGLLAAGLQYVRIKHTLTTGYFEKMLQDTDEVAQMLQLQHPALANGLQDKKKALQQVVQAWEAQSPTTLLELGQASRQIFSIYQQLVNALDEARADPSVSHRISMRNA